MSKFKVGEVVILQSIHFPQHNGEEMTVLKIEPANSFADPSRGDGYVTDFHPVKGGCWSVSALRKKPKQQLSTWQELAHLWVPDELTEVV